MAEIRECARRRSSFSLSIRPGPKKNVHDRGLVADGMDENRIEVEFGS
ncbi:MAG: hypothetical protein IH933_00575 [Euryarchaeota archaeon]|nr:hypothetical protein [Euryarchaeota archaeon]